MRFDHELPQGTTNNGFCCVKRWSLIQEFPGAKTPNDASIDGRPHKVYNVVKVWGHWEGSAVAPGSSTAE